LEGHKPLSIVEEPDFVFVSLEDSSPGFWTASTCEILDWTGTKCKG
jgi:hypothetical protein